MRSSCRTIRKAIITISLQDADGHCRSTDCPLPQSNILYAENTLENGYIAFSRLLEKQDRPDAVFIATDTMAFGAIEKLNQAGLTPEEIASHRVRRPEGGSRHRTEADHCHKAILPYGNDRRKTPLRYDRGRRRRGRAADHCTAVAPENPKILRK